MKKTDSSGILKELQSEKKMTLNIMKSLENSNFTNHLPPSSSLSWFLSDAEVVSGPELSSMEMKLTGLDPGPVVAAAAERLGRIDPDEAADSRGNMARIRCTSFRSRSRSSSRSWMISCKVKATKDVNCHKFK